MFTHIFVLPLELRYIQNSFVGGFFPFSFHRVYFYTLSVYYPRCNWFRDGTINDQLRRRLCRLSWMGRFDPNFFESNKTKKQKQKQILSESLLFSRLSRRRGSMTPLRLIRLSERCRRGAPSYDHISTCSLATNKRIKILTAFMRVIASWPAAGAVSSMLINIYTVQLYTTTNCILDGANNTHTVRPCLPAAPYKMTIHRSRG